MGEQERPAQRQLPHSVLSHTAVPTRASDSDGEQTPCTCALNAQDSSWID